MRIIAALFTFGHDAYGLPGRPGLFVEPVWEPGDPDLADALDACKSDEAIEELWTGHTGFAPEELPGDDIDLMYETIAIVYGREHIVGQALDDLIVELAVDPGGDDGTFDYWPSGVRLAQALDHHLGGIRAAAIREAVDTVIALKAAKGLDLTAELLDRCGYEPTTPPQEGP